MQKRSLVMLLATWVVGTFADTNVIDVSKDVTPIENEAVTKYRGQVATPAFQRPIKPSDLNHHAASSNGMYTINLSGRYYISQDLRPSPTKNSSYVININASNVSLDMNKKTIVRNMDSSSGTGLTAINVAASKYNIQIMDGIVQGNNTNSQFIGTGISIGSGCRLINISGVQVNQCNVAGIVATSTNNLNITNCAANECSGSAALSGLSLTSCKDSVIRDSFFNLNTTSSGKAVGALLTSCSNVTVENCHASSTSTTSTGTNAYGIELSSCSNCTFNNCFTNGNTSAAGNATGFVIISSPVNSFVNCKSNYHIAVGGDALGFDIQSGSNSCILENCTSSSNDAQSAAQGGFGFKIAADGNHLNKCTANKNIASNAAGSDAYGMYLTGSDSNIIENSEMNNNGSTAANAYGVYLTNCTNTSFLNCQAKGNIATADDQEAIGFFSNAGSVNRFENCIANGQTCSGSTGGTSQLAAGFKFQGSEARSQILSCEAVGNNGGGGSDSRAYGVFMSGSSAATDCMLKDTLMAHNTVSAGRKYGFYDGSTSISTVLLNNTSIAHGQCLVSATMNASNQFLDTENSGMNYFYNHAGTGDDPRFTIAEAPKYNLTSISTSVGGWESVSLY